jgi:hypothetical protein
MALVREVLAKAVRRTADFDPGLQVRPACILWPDGKEQWEAAIPALQKDIPELLVLNAEVFAVSLFASYLTRVCQVSAFSKRCPILLARLYNA